MLKPDQIPDEVVKAAARAVCEAENGPCECLPDECGCTYWLAHARASIAAALSAWPGVVQNYNWDGSRWRIVLPGSQEGGDA